MTFGYDADIVDFKTMASQENLRSNAKNLLESLNQVRPADDPATAQRPLFFVTHSLGGLLCKQALVLASSRDQYRPLFDANAGIIFIGTPHKGSKQAKLGGRLVSMVNMFRPANRGLVKMLEEQSPQLSALDDDFWTLMDECKPECFVHCYHESAPMSGLGIIVTRESASRPGGSSSPLDGDHSNMLKFGTAQDVGYLKIQDKLSTWTRSINHAIAGLPRQLALPAAPQGLPGNPVASVSEDTMTTTPAALTEQIAPDVQALHSEPTPVIRPVSPANDLQSPQAETLTKFHNCTFQKQVLPGIVNKDHSSPVFNLS